MRTVLVFLVALVGWLGAGVVAAAPAAAHATLVSTDPAEGARLDDAPDAVTLEFSEGVSLGAGYARVSTADGQEVDGGEASVDGRVVTIPLPDGMEDGGYLVAYRVISSDSHPISGAYSFVVGEGELVPAGASAETADADPVVAALLPVVRAIGYGGIALAVGIPVLALLCWPAGWRSGPLRRLATGGALTAAVAALLTFLLQGPYSAGTGLADVVDPDLISATVTSGGGWSLLVRAVLALALAAALAPAWRRGEAPHGPRLAAAATFAIGLVVATAAIGHPVAGSWPVLAVAVAAVHVAAMAVWLGGLTGLLLGLLRPGPDAHTLAAAMSRFSRVAFAAVVALVVSGVVQAVREVASPTALFGSTYGRLLLVKIVVVLVVLGAAGVSRVWVQQRLGVRRPRPGGVRRVTAQAFAAPAGETVGGGDGDETASARERAQAEHAVDHLPSLRRSMLVEAVAAALILVLSGVLVGTPPARSSVAQPVDVVLALQGTSGEAGSVQLSVDPGTVGPNELRLYLFDPQGRLTQPADIDVSLVEPSQDLGPIAVTLQPAGPGHYVAPAMPVPSPGTWTVTVSVRLDEFSAATASTDLRVR
ncbi:copper resistance protein CopC [Blastococcus sp. CCUG 61487]|nr:copper resistance protein CopC [Blastococcus sp. CCUG 61487]